MEQKLKDTISKYTELIRSFKDQSLKTEQRLQQNEKNIQE